MLAREVQRANEHDVENKFRTFVKMQCICTATTVTLHSVAQSWNNSQPSLARRLGTLDAVVIGLGSMIGAGVFVTFGPAAAAAGNWLFAALAVAAIVAFCNATSTARLAAVHPTSGGTYVFGTRQLGPLWGFLAGWLFVIGKTASCAAMALTVAHYILPDTRSALAGPLAALVVVAITVLNLFGIQKSAKVTRYMVGFVLISMLVVLGFSWFLPRHNDFGWTMYQPLAEAGHGITDGLENWGLQTIDFHSWNYVSANPGIYGILQAAGFLFFAFAGYARIATLGEEVKDPSRIIPRAIPIALGITLVFYALIAFVLVQELGLSYMANVAQPLRELAAGTQVKWLVILISATAVVAATGSLLTMILGVSRTGLAMARDGHLPRQLTVVGSRHQVPWAMEMAVAVIIIAIVLVTDVVYVIGFSSFGVLLYYAIANVSAMSLKPEQNRPVMLIPLVGLLGCIFLASSVPVQSLVAGGLITMLGVAVFGVRQALQNNSRSG